MKVGVVKEIRSGEHRVSLLPDSVSSFIKSGLEVLIEKGAGESAFIPDDSYGKAGAQLISDRASVYEQADIILKVRRPLFDESKNVHEVDLIKKGSILVSFLYPSRDLDFVKKCIDKRITSFGMELIPRISRAQKMDVLSSQSTVAGYLSVLIAASALPKFFPLLMTAAGTVPPARVFILGAGVAGLQAIATARRLGAKVEAFDVRPEVKEQVESLGAKFVGVALEEAKGAGGYAKELSKESHQKEQEILTAHTKEADVVITTALIPGKKAPVLITEDMVKGMKSGSVIVDLAADQGGNCTLTEAGREVIKYSVKIVGPMNIPSMMPLHASQMYSRNIMNFVNTFVKDGKLNLDFNDEVIRDSCLTHQGEIVSARMKSLLESQKEKV